MLKKRGSSQIDWAVSLALFLLFIAWFFVFIRPTAEQPADNEQLLIDLKESFEEEALLEVKKTPLIINGYFEQDDFPLYLRVPDLHNFAFFDNRPFAYVDKRIMFLEDLEKGKTAAWLVESDEEYSQPDYASNLFANGSILTSARIRVEFQNGTLQKVYYDNELKIDGFELRKGTTKIQTENTDQYYSKLVYRKKMMTDRFDYSTYIFDQNNIILNVFDFFGQENVTARMKLHGYREYYANNLNFGNINYSIPNCRYFKSSFIDFSGDDRLSFVLEEEADIEMCYKIVDGDREVWLEINYLGDNSLGSYIIFHNRQFNQTLELVNFPEVKKGMAETARGYSADKIKELSEGSYLITKNRWNFPRTKEFEMEITAGEDEFPIHDGKTPENANIFAKTVPCTLIDKYAKYAECSMVIRTWA